MESCRKRSTSAPAQSVRPAALSAAIARRCVTNPQKIVPAMHRLHANLTASSTGIVARRRRIVHRLRSVPLTPTSVLMGRVSIQSLVGRSNVLRLWCALRAACRAPADPALLSLRIVPPPKPVQQTKLSARMAPARPVPARVVMSFHVPWEPSAAPTAAADLLELAPRAPPVLLATSFGK